MKRFLLIPSCALLAMGVLTSCQKEDKSALELTQELTAELQKVTDYRTAEASAARVAALNKRLQNATVRPATLGSSALLKSDQGDKGAAFAEATVKLARELGRVRSSVPVTTADGEVDADMLIMATGVASGASAESSASARKAAGQKYIKHDADKSHENPPTFDECYGSSKLKEALAYTADPASVSLLKIDSDEDVPAIPEPTEVAEAPEEPAADTEEPTADTTEEPAADDDTVEPAPADDDTEEPAPAPAPAEPADDSTDDADSGDISVDVEADDTASDDEPAAEEDSTGDDGGDDESLDLDISVDDL